MLIIINKRKRSSKSKWSNSNKNTFFQPSRGQQLTSGMSTILLSFWSLQFQSRTRYLNACKLKPSGEPNQSEKTSKALKLNERGRSQTHTSLNESADPPWCPHSYVVDAFLQQLHLLFYLCKKKNDTDNHSMKSFTVHNLHTACD